MAPWQVMGIFDHIDDKWSYWKSLFLNVIDSHAPLMKVRVKQSGSCDNWIDSELRSLMRTRNYYHKKHQRTHDPVDWEMFKSLRNQVNHQLKRAKADHYTSICKDMSRNAKPTWDHLNSALGRTSHKPINSINCNNTSITRAADIVNAFAKHFGSVHSPDPPNYKTRLTLLPTVFKFSIISEQTVAKKLASLNVRKATGPDGILAKLLKMVALAISPSLTSLFNSSLLQGQFPAARRQM